MCIISSKCVVQLWSAKKCNIGTVLDLFSLFLISSIPPSLSSFLPPLLPSPTPYPSRVCVWVIQLLSLVQ